MKAFKNKLRKIKDGEWSDGKKKYYIPETPTLNSNFNRKIDKVLNATENNLPSFDVGGTIKNSGYSAEDLIAISVVVG